MVTHDVQEAFELGTRICLMDKGKVQQTGTPAELLFSPANDFVRSFFDEHRFVLELKALTIANIRPWLTQVNGEDNFTVWDAIAAGMPRNTLLDAVDQYRQSKYMHGTS
jgi:osmoprotectant transport system ATP-binding protein